MHVNYTEQQLFKSAKVAFVMMASHFMLDLRTSKSAITYAMLLCGGLAIFSVADYNYINKKNNYNTPQVRLSPGRFHPYQKL